MNVKNMQYQEMVSQMHELQDFNEYRQAQLNSVLKFIKDREIPLKQRWFIYKKAVKANLITKVERYIVHFSGDLDVYSWYDEFYKERHEVIDFVELVEEQLRESEERKHLIPEYKEAILQFGIKGFIYDW